LLALSIILEILHHFHPISPDLAVALGSSPRAPVPGGRAAFHCRTPLEPAGWSAARDLLFTTVLASDRRFDISLLSIRTCGCRARVVVSTDADKEFGPHFTRVMALTSA
jgi:hypothetical protein